MKKCQRNPVCYKGLFQKNDGVPRLGRWFCSVECTETDEEIKQMIAEKKIVQEEEVQSEDSDEVEVYL